MSYQTIYRLEWKEENPTANEVARALALTGETGSQDQRLAGLFSDAAALEKEAALLKQIIEGDDETTWYEHEADVSRVSRLWPEVVFTLYLNGEDSKDFSVEYHRNGKVHREPGEIVYGEFDPEKLETPAQPERRQDSPPEPDVFLHRGVLVRRCQDEFKAAALPDSGPGTISNLSLPTNDREEARGMIDRMLDAAPETGFRLTETNLQEEAKAQALEALHEAISNLQPGVLYHEMSEIPEAREKVAGYLQRWTDRTEDLEVQP